MEFNELNVDTRTDTGKGVARTLRRDGKIPAILYGPGTEPVMLSVETHDLELLLKKRRIGQMLLNLAIQNGGQSVRPAIIKELQRHPVSGSLVHVDFYEISMDRKIKVRIPVSVKGKSIGVEMGGILQIIRRDLEVLCLPGDVPENIEIDVTELNTGDAVHVRDIVPEGNIEIPSEVNFTVVTVLAPKGDKAEEGEEEEGEEGEEGEAEKTAE